MSKLVANLTLSNGEILKLDSDTMIFVYNGDSEDSKDPYASGGMHYTLGEHRHHHAGYAPFLIGLLSDNDFFSVNNDNALETKIYQSSSVVSISHSDSKVNVRLFKEGL